eukprot:ANDGO_07358.mRNA.1 Aryl-alcohol dehydrogenase
MSAVQAAVVDSVGSPFRLTELTFSRVPRANELLIRVVASGVCHTDVAVRDGHIPTPFPCVLGHEGCGVVEVVGGPDSGCSFEVGDWVMVSYGSCGACVNCLAGKPSYCTAHRANFATVEKAWSEQSSEAGAGAGAGTCIGSHFFGQSSHATRTIVYAANCVKLNKEYLQRFRIPLKRLAPLGCGLQTGMGAVLNALKPAAGASIAVFGTGAVGLAAVMGAVVAGCTTIIGVDLHDSRLTLASELGCTHVINSRGKSRDQVIAEIAACVASGATTTAGGVAGIEYAIDTTGNAEVLRTAFEALRPTGVCALVGGSAPGTTVQLPMDKILLGRTIRGVIQGDAISKVFLPRLIELHAQGRFPFEKIITYYTGGLGDINQAVQDSLSGKTIKPVLVLSEE